MAKKRSEALEINTFTNPVPHHDLLIDSNVGDFLRHRGEEDLIRETGIEAEPIKCWISIQ